MKSPNINRKTRRLHQVTGLVVMHFMF